MIKIDDQFMAVFTKYDNPFVTIKEPRMGQIEASAPTDVIWPDFLPMEMIEYKAKRIENGLEGLIIVTYER